MNRKTLIAVLGPTASGKTSWSIDIARHYSSHILSCDSRQFYKELNIGVARPSLEELSRAKHHFIADRSIHQPISAGEYEREALAILDDLFDTNPVQVLVGGSGLFAKALFEGFDDMPEVDPSIRATLNSIYAESGIEPLVAELRKVDPTHAAVVDIDNHQRVIRALEIYRQTGQPYSNFRLKKKADRPFDIIKIAPDWPREMLYDRINTRVDQMVEEGLEQEARSVYEYRDLSSLQTVGYREWFEHFDGVISRDEAIDKVKKNSRNYAKRQLTWNRKESDLTLYKHSEFARVLDDLDAKLK